MPVAVDSYMGIFLPTDIRQRIKEFMAERIEFPFVNSSEILATFHLFGKNYGLKHDDEELTQAADLAKRTVQQIVADIRLYSTIPGKTDPKMTRQNYTKRSLQIIVESQGNLADMNERVAGDPVILADCFAQHVAYNRQNFFFELFGPLKADQLPSAIVSKLAGRMVLLGFNTGDRKNLPFPTPLEPFFDFIEETQQENKL